VARPRITLLYLGNHSRSRSSSGPANFPNVAPGVQVSVQAFVSFDSKFGPFSASIGISCDGVAQTLHKTFDNCSTVQSCFVEYNWVPPVAGGVCKLTANALAGNLADSFSAGVLVR
jgi:hypothetical protein